MVALKDVAAEAAQGFGVLLGLDPLGDDADLQRLGVLLLYDGYLLLMSLAVLAYTVWPSAIEWKARRYAWAEG